MWKKELAAMETPVGWHIAERILVENLNLRHVTSLAEVGKESRIGGARLDVHFTC